MPTNLAPLWTGSFPTGDRKSIAKQILNYIEKNQLDIYQGGVPNTLTNSGQQWDFPNVWPPMQYILIEGLRNLGTRRSLALAYKWSARWIRSNYIGYENTHVMFEKVGFLCRYIYVICICFRYFSVD